MAENIDAYDFKKVRFSLEEIADTPECKDQVQNDADNYTFQHNDKTRVRRFLILGTSSGTYYVNRAPLAYRNVLDLVQILKNGDGGLILHELYDVSVHNRAPNQSATMFALALCVRAKYFKRIDLTIDQLKKYDEYTSKLSHKALELLPKICRIPKHLFEFLRFATLISTQTENTKGWGRPFRKAIANWYLQVEPRLLAVYFTKHNVRERYSHRDTLRLAHPNAKKNSDKAELYNQLFSFACENKMDVTEQEENYEPIEKRVYDCELMTELMEIEKRAPMDQDILTYLQNFIELKGLPYDSPSVNRVVDLIKKNCFDLEQIPPGFLDYLSIWKALLPDMPLITLLNNLPMLSFLEIIDGSRQDHQEYKDLVIKKLTNKSEVKKIGIHPFFVTLAWANYKLGYKVHDMLTWNVHSDISSALYLTFLAAFENVQPTGKRYLLAFDISYSMDEAIIRNTSTSARIASVAMGFILVHSEPYVETVYFGSILEPFNFSKEWTLNQAISSTQKFKLGRVNCTAPMIWAMENQKLFDVFIIYTDSEIRYEFISPFEALKQYREKSKIPDAKLIVIGMTANPFTIADPTDSNMLDILGVNSSTPEVIRNFINGYL